MSSYDKPYLVTIVRTIKTIVEVNAENASHAHSIVESYGVS
jgi:hypothetical protein